MASEENRFTRALEDLQRLSLEKGIPIAIVGGLAAIRYGYPAATLGVKQGLDYATLSGWIELKISSGRQKDRAHVVEVMKKADAESLRSARECIAMVHQSYVALFDQLFADAEEERVQEEERRERGIERERKVPGANGTAGFVA